MAMCRVCGGAVFAPGISYGYSGPVCYWQGSHPTAHTYQVSFPSFNTPQNNCEHCFCKEEKVNLKDHKRCCNCGIKKLLEME